MRAKRYSLARLLKVAFCGVMYSLWLSDHSGHTFGFAFLALVLSFCIAILLHELGHMIAGLTSGMRPVYMIVGPVGFHWEPGQFLPRLRTNAFMLGGFALCAPRSDKAVRIRMILMTAAGPAASLVLMAAAGAVAFNTTGDVSFTAGLTSATSAIVMFTTVIPFPGKGMTNDGAKIKTLLRNGPHGRALAACLCLIGESRRGVRPASWPSDLLETAIAADKGSALLISALHYVYWAALDAGETEAAERVVSGLLEKTSGAPESLTAPIAYEAAAFRLFVRGDVEAARGLIKGRKLPAFEDQYVEPLVRAGLALADGDMEEAGRCVHSARTSLPHALLPSVAALHARWLEGVEAEIARAADLSAYGATA